MFRRVSIGIAAVGAIVVVLVGAHLALIEIGREVVTLRTENADGTRKETRLWIVDDAGASWLHSAGPDWIERFEGNPEVELVRGGRTLRCLAHPVPGPHQRLHALMHEKYGVADRWVRFVAADPEDTLVVRLDACTETPGAVPADR